MSLLPSVISIKGPVLIAGAGGGFDFFCGLPIVLELEEAGHEVFLANYSFTDLFAVEQAHKMADNFFQVDADSFLSEGDYFPEKLLCRWYREVRNKDVAIYCFGRQGVAPLLEHYNWIIEKHQIDTVICIDGGVDGIFRGDEHDLGTPSMDSISVITTSLCNARQKIYCCTAFGSEGAEGKVSHAQALARMADLTRVGASLGVGQVLPQTEIGRTFIDAAESVFSWLPSIKRSIIVSTILASMNGRFGRTSVTAKTRERKPWISPLQSLYWYFDANAVAKMKLFYNEVIASTTVAEVVEAIEKLREEQGTKSYEEIPI